MFNVKDRVTIPGIGTGYIVKIYNNEDGNISVIMMDDPKASCGGFYLVRDCEMKPASGAAV